METYEEYDYMHDKTMFIHNMVKIRDAPVCQNPVRKAFEIGLTYPIYERLLVNDRFLKGKKDEHLITMLMQEFDKYLDHIMPIRALLSPASKRGFTKSRHGKNERGAEERLHA